MTKICLLRGTSARKPRGAPSPAEHLPYAGCPMSVYWGDEWVGKWVNESGLKGWRVTLENYEPPSSVWTLGFSRDSSGNLALCPGFIALQVSTPAGGFFHLPQSGSGLVSSKTWVLAENCWALGRPRHPFHKTMSRYVHTRAHAHTWTVNGAHCGKVTNSSQTYPGLSSVQHWMSCAPGTLSVPSKWR